MLQKICVLLPFGCLATFEMLRPIHAAEHLTIQSDGSTKTRTWTTTYGEYELDLLLVFSPWVFAIGGGTVKNSFLTDMSASGMYGDMGLKIGKNLLSFGQWVDIRLYVGYRAFLMITSIGSISGFDANPNATLTQNSLYNAGVSGKVFAREWDIFHGPQFGVSLRF